MRWATLVLLTLLACNDLRDFHGEWRGARVGDAEVLARGFTGKPEARLAIDRIDLHGLSGRLEIAGVLPEAPIVPIDGAEADALAGLTFTGGPLRTYLAFVAMPDGAGDALAVVALYDDRRVEVRVLRGGPLPLYGIFALTESVP